MLFEISFQLFLIILFITMIFTPVMNYYFDTYFGTNYQNKTNSKSTKKSVSFSNDEVVHYYLSSQERNMKRKAYKEVCKSSDHYRRMDYLNNMMNGLKIE